MTTTPTTDPPAAAASAEAPQAAIAAAVTDAAPPVATPAIDPSEVAALRDEIGQLRHIRGQIKAKFAEIAEQEKKVQSAKDRLKTLENDLEELNTQLYEVIDGPGPQGKLPFGNGGITQGASAPAAEGAPKYTDGPWRDVGVEQLGLSDAITEKIKADGCNSIGKLVDKASKDPEKRGYRCIKGIGERSAEKINDAVDSFIMGKNAPKDPNVQTDTDGVPMLPLPGHAAPAAELEEDLTVKPTKYDYAGTWPTLHNPERSPAGGVEAYVRTTMDAVKPLIADQLELERCLFRGIDPATNEKAKDAVRNSAEIQNRITPIEQDINGKLGEYAGYFSWDDANDLTTHVKNLLIAGSSPDKK